MSWLQLLLLVAVSTSTARSYASGGRHHAFLAQSTDAFDDPDSLKEYLLNLNRYFASLGRPRYNKRVMDNAVKLKADAQ
ncbi:hypothetical protein BOX15_Mlig008652g2 [Macrostomum lignano]|uniref:Uncharacterized protein n=2 Tax=Macrostomum lignano TaxID=282301 RepID=A0A267H096_9PLAT|nr:hypothetical protein BOX15_Mlig008652g2 [Macrostomum lignano]